LAAQHLQANNMIDSAFLEKTWLTTHFWKKKHDWQHILGNEHELQHILGKKT
jgi:hypothetical protein